MKSDNLGPIGLSNMVVISRYFLQRLEEKSIAIALTLDIGPNNQDLEIQYTVEFEKNEQIDITIKNNEKIILL